MMKETVLKTKLRERFTFEVVKFFSQAEVYLYSALILVSLIFYDAVSNELREWKEAYRQLDFYFTHYDYPDYNGLYKRRALSRYKHYSKYDLKNHILERLPENLQKEAAQYIPFILECSEKYQVDPLWITAIIWTESHFYTDRVSPLGASGLMQIMPYTSRYIEENMESGVFPNYSLSKSKVDRSSEKLSHKKLANSYQNIEYGISYFKHLLENFNYNFDYATVAYNMGPGLIQLRLKKNLPVGRRNDYLIKVKKAYQLLLLKG